MDDTTNAVDAHRPEKVLRLRYAATCRVCGLDLPAKTRAVYDAASRTVRCESCPDDVAASAPEIRSVDAQIDIGTAGASARREHERRVVRREERVRKAHPKLGGLILALSDDPQSTRAWATGAEGEERLAARLEQAPTARVLHDRRIPGTRANIDHIAVAPSGVYVIDAKKYKGRPELKVEGGILRPRVEKLLVGGRDKTSLLDGVHKQVRVVTEVLADDSVPVHGVLCFVEADWPLIGGAFRAQGCQVLWPRKLVEMLTAAGTLSPDDIERIHRGLATRLSPA